MLTSQKVYKRKMKSKSNTIALKNLLGSCAKRGGGGGGAWTWRSGGGEKERDFVISSVREIL